MRQKNDSIIKNLRNNPYFWLFFLTSALFGILFIRFILGDYAYFYTDMGRDTFDINYPLYRFFADVVHGKGYSDYNLNVGLGMDMSSYLYQYLNPINFLVVILPSGLIPWGVLLATYLKLLTISLVGYRLFYCWIGSPWPSAAAALLWTFSSYVMLWGQHYGFCTSVMLFTVLFYLVHLYIAPDKKSRNWLLVLWITLMLFSNYYFLYMCGLMCAMYVVIYLAFQKESWKVILRKTVGLGLMAVLGMCIGGGCLVSTYDIFTESARVSSAGVGNVRALFRPYSQQRMLSAASRLMGNNLLGIADDYTGSKNYYEIPMLFTSCLFFFSLPYLLTEKKTRGKTLFLTVLSILFLLFPFSGKLFNLNQQAHRWTLIICMMEVLAAGLFLKMLTENPDRKKVKGSVLSGAGLTAVLLAFLIWGQTKEYYEIQIPYVVIFVVFLAVSAVLVLLRGCRGKMKKTFPVIFTLVLCAELAVTNFPTINFRDTPTRNQVASEYYNDGTRETYDQLEQEDPSLYRVIKTYQSESMNDALVQGYNGVTAYMTTNPGALVNLKAAFGGTGVTVNFIAFEKENFVLNTLLGVKYLIARPGEIVSEDTYTFVKTMGTHNIYRNNDTLPFGYLYDCEWDAEEFLDMDVNQRALAALHGFYFTDEKSGTGYGRAERSSGTGVSLLDQEFQACNCEAVRTDQGITFSDMGEDPYIVMNDVDQVAGQEGFSLVSMEFSVEEEVDMALYYKYEGQNDFVGDQVLTFTVDPKNPEWNYVIPGDVTDFRIDPSSETDELTICRLEVYSCEDDHTAMEKLAASPVTNVTWSDETYHATVVNDNDDTEMFCIPLLYGNGWSAAVDGEEVRIYDINGGFCGVELEGGRHEVELHYETPHKKAGIALSTAGILLYVIWLAAGRMRRRKDGLF